MPNPAWVQSRGWCGRREIEAEIDSVEIGRHPALADLAAQSLKAPQEEVYVGFHELDQLELRAVPANGGPDDAASLRCPWIVNPLPLTPPPPIPPDLSELLGEDGCRALREASERGPFHSSR